MTLLGKVFTVLILVMSVVFMSFAVVVYATHVNWKELVTGPEGLQSRVQSTQDKIKQLQRELEVSRNALTREQAARRFVIAALRTKLETSDVELKQKVADLDSLQATHADLAQSNQTATTTLQRLSEETKELRQTVITTIDDRNTVFDNVVNLTDSLNRMEGTRKTLSERNGELLADLTRAQGHLESVGIRLGDELPTGPPNLIGFVTQVSKEKLIEISLGDDDGIRKGHTLFVYRGGTFLGRAVVRETSADFAVAEIIEEVNRSVLIRKGDNVATKLG